MPRETDLTHALVELTAPDGRVFQFRYGATVPYAGQDYVVLISLEDAPAGQEQLLVTRLVEEDGALSFVVAEEEDVVENVYTKFVTLAIQQSIADLPEAEDGCGCHDDDCGCHDDGCGCHHRHPVDNR